VEVTRDDARAVVARLIDAYNRKDEEALAALYHPDITYWSALSGSRQGKEAVLAHLRELFGRLPDERMGAVTVVADAETAVVEFESTGTAGRPYRLAFTEVISLADGLVSAISVYLDPEEVTSALEG
jgi:uncharacterized protein (TIGR02246 family)